MARLRNMARMSVASAPGTGTITLGSAVSGWLSFSDAGIQDGEIVTYFAVDGAAREIGRGTYTASGTTLARTTILRSTNSNSAVTLTASAQVAISPAAEDFLIETNAQTGTTYTIVGNDLGKLITFSNASAVAVTLPQATTSGLFSAGWFARFVNIGAGVVTITPTTSTINGRTSVSLSTGQGITIVSNGSNYLTAGYAGGRETLTAARTYYVRTDGSDTNNGLANTSGGAFLTIQKAVDTAAALDSSTFDVTISVGDGSRTEQVTLRPLFGTGQMILTGNTSTPANCTLTATSGQCFTGSDPRGRWSISGFKLSTVTLGYQILLTRGTLRLGANDYGAAAAGYSHILISDHASVTYTSNFTISGGGYSHILANNNSVCTMRDYTATLSGTPAFTAAFAYITQGAVFFSVSMTFSGSATGSRYTVASNGVIETFGAGASYLPGNSAGSTTTGGQYA